MPYPKQPFVPLKSHRTIARIMFCPLCGEPVPEFECESEQYEWLDQHRNVVELIEVDRLPGDSSSTDNGPF